MTQELLYDKRGEIGWITFNRPQARNALTFAMYEGLAEICSRVAQTREVRALVITGAGDKAIAAVCDLRLATTNAQFGFPIARTLGNCLSMANYARLAALIGPQRVKEVILLAKLVDAPTALQIGLVSELLTDVAALHARAEALAKTLAGHAPITMQVTKEALRR